MAEIFKPGDHVPSTGVYKVTHKFGHVPAHDVVAIFDDVFPLCKTCGDAVEFEVVYAAIYVRAHPHFM